MAPQSQSSPGSRIPFPQNASVAAEEEEEGRRRRRRGGEEEEEEEGGGEDDRERNRGGRGANIVTLGINLVWH